MDDTNYLDLIILKKIDASSTVEKFGTSINTSFFETANILGTLKVKGLIDIQTSIGGQSPVTLTGEGKETLEHASRKASEPLDELDKAVMASLASGIRDLSGLNNTINIRPKDLAFHLNKLKVNDYVDYEARSGKVSLSLTEKGFNMTGGMKAVKPTEPEGEETAGPASSQKTSFHPQIKSQAAPWAAFFQGKGGEKQKPATAADISEIIGDASAKPAPPKTGTAAPAWGASQQPAPQSSQPASTNAAPAFDKLGMRGEQNAPEKKPSQSSGSPPWVAQKGAQKQAAAPPWASLKTHSKSPPWAAPTAADAASAPKEAVQKKPAGDSAQKPAGPKMDVKTLRMYSKLMYYLKTYTLYAILLFLLLLLVAYSVMAAGNKAAMQ